MAWAQRCVIGDQFRGAAVKKMVPGPVDVTSTVADAVVPSPARTTEAVPLAPSKRAGPVAVSVAVAPRASGFADTTRTAEALPSAGR